MRHLLLLAGLCAVIGCNSDLKEENVQLRNRNVVLSGERDMHRAVAGQVHRENVRIESALDDAKKSAAASRKAADEKARELEDANAELKQELSDQQARAKLARDQLAEVIQDMILGKTEKIEKAVKSASSEAERAMLMDALKITRMRAGQ